MPLDVIVGAQWGDEGKGRMVDLLAAGADYVARYNGGDNAGHTVTVGDQTFRLHLVPSGLIHPHTVGVLGNGMVINPETLLTEIADLERAGIEVTPDRLRISHAAHLITPGHRALDQAQERARGEGQIGTTGRGIGPAYTDKAARRGLRVEAMLSIQSFGQAVRDHIQAVNKRLVDLYGQEPLDIDEVIQAYARYAEKLAPHIADTGAALSLALSQGKTVLAEGAQGTLLDLEHGTYPYVTSSHPTASGVLMGLGLGLRQARRVVGVAKTFQTRVGEGPFPTEVDGATARRLRGTGENPWDEFGTTTGRPRRVGWLDAVLLRYAVRVNGFNTLALIKLDVLSGLDPLRICVAYRTVDRKIDELPRGPADLSPYTPVYEELPGWQGDVCAARRWEDLPPQAQDYVRRIEALTGMPAGWISVGPEREQLVDRT
jgi:adenylosuccinate synthase